MLIRYQRNYEKIAMGLLSFMPKEKNLKVLCQTMNLYEQDKNRQLFLWKETDIIGIIGIKKLSDHLVELCHLCVNPSFRGQGIATKMLEGLIHQLGSQVGFAPTDDTKNFFEHYQKRLSNLHS